MPIGCGVELGGDCAPIAPRDACDSSDTHQAGDLDTADVAAAPAQAVPQLEHAVQAALVVEQTEHLVGGVCITH